MCGSTASLSGQCTASCLPIAFAQLACHLSLCSFFVLHSPLIYLSPGDRCSFQVTHWSWSQQLRPVFFVPCAPSLQPGWCGVRWGSSIGRPWQTISQTWAKTPAFPGRELFKPKLSCSNIKMHQPTILNRILFAAKYMTGVL